MNTGVNETALQDIPREASDIKFYIKKNESGVCTAIYRLFKLNGLVGEYRSWKDQRWIKDEDIVRRYWNGLDADVEKATIKEVVQCIRDRTKSQL